MLNKEIHWFMRLTLVNNQSGNIAFTMYPCEKYKLLESLDWCNLTYGSGDYSHLAKSANAVEADSLQVALTGVIEHPEHPPSIHELNYLGTQIQSMSKQTRSLLKKEIAEQPGTTIVEAVNAAHRLLLTGLVYDGESLSERAVLWGEEDPYICVQLVPDDGDEYSQEEDGVWIGCPANESELQAVAEEMGAASYKDLFVNGVYGVVEKIDNDMCEPFVTFDDINNWAIAMKEHEVYRELSKYKAILELELCGDLGEATVLAGELDNYEFYPAETLCEVGGHYRNDHPLCKDKELGDLAKNLGFEDTHYGIVRKTEGTSLEHHGLELR